MADQNSTYIYIAFGIGIFGLILALMGGALSLIGGIFTGISALSGVLFTKYDYISIPMLTQKTKTITLQDLGTYEMPPSQDTILKNIGDTYFASAFLSIEVSKSPTEETREENLRYNEFFERAVSSMRHVTKIAYLIKVENMNQKKNEIEQKRAESSLKLAKERQKPIDKDGKQRLILDQYEKEFELWDKQLAKISKGRKPMGILAYSMVTASGSSKEAAISNARSYAEEVKIALSNSLSVDVKILNGEDMLQCFEYEKFFPTTIQEIEGEALTL